MKTVVIAYVLLALAASGLCTMPAVSEAAEGSVLVLSTTDTRSELVPCG